MFANKPEAFKKCYELFISGARPKECSTLTGIPQRTVESYFYKFRHEKEAVEKELDRIEKLKLAAASFSSKPDIPAVVSSEFSKKAIQPASKEKLARDIELEFFAEYEACDDFEMAASRVGLSTKEAGKLLIARMNKIEEEATKKKNALPIQKLASNLPKSWTTKDKAKHIVIPDVQVKPGQDFEFLRCVGEYIAENMPDAVICIGDFGDLPSLSTYDKGKKSAEGKRYSEDIKAVKQAMAVLMAPIHRKMKETGWKPLLILTLGNHEHRISRAADLAPEFFGHIKVEDLEYESFGWIVYPFLEVVEVDGVCYSHYFTTGVMGRPASSARAMIQKKHQSCVMGHVQKDEIHTEYNAKGEKITGLFVGCCYMHDEDYLGYQGNNYWRGIWMLYKIQKGSFSHLQADLDFLLEKY